MTNMKGFNSLNFHKIQYAHVSSIIKASTASENSDEKDHETLNSSVADMEIDEASEKGVHNKDSCESSDG